MRNPPPGTTIATHKDFPRLVWGFARLVWGRKGLDASGGKRVPDFGKEGHNLSGYGLRDLVHLTTILFANGLLSTPNLLSQLFPPSVRRSSPPTYLVDGPQVTVLGRAAPPP